MHYLEYIIQSNSSLISSRFWFINQALQVLILDKRKKCTYSVDHYYFSPDLLHNQKTLLMNFLSSLNSFTYQY